MSKKTTQKLPELRFPEFEGEWDESKLEALTSFISKGTTPSKFSDFGVNYVKIECLNGIHIIKDRCAYIDEEIHFKELKRSILKENDILFAIAGATVGKVGVVTSEILPANTNQALAIIRLKNYKQKYFILHILESVRMKKYIQESISVGAQPNLNLKQINDFKFYHPQQLEQQKIANFLTAVDKNINLLTQKKTLLEQYKKGVMQKIFNQEIRFQPDSQEVQLAQAAEPIATYGNNRYPDWGVKKLGDVLDYEQPTKYLVSDTEYDNSFLTPVLTAGKTFLLGYTNEINGIFKEKLPTIIFDDFTTAFQFVDFPFKAKSSAMKMLIPKNKNVNLKYVFSAMQMLKFPLGEHKRYWISEFQHQKIKYPCLEEQQKIATFLSALDDKITNLQTQIDHYTTWKKGLLQRMFV